MSSPFYSNLAHSSWNTFFSENTKKLEEIYQKISCEDYTPSEENVLKFSRMPLESIKYVILGQDPYPAKNAATGLAFEVFGLRDWCEPFAQVSLKNILRLIYLSYFEELVSWKDLKELIKSGRFPVLPPDKLFKSWNRQGVLLLNTSLTCKIGESDSHKKLWAGFTQSLISYISRNVPDAVWFLWGNNAKQYAELIESGKIFS